MSHPETKQLFADYVAPTYGRYDLVLERGEGVRVWDERGKCYLDFGAGIAVSVLGHGHPAIVEALSRQSRRLIHTSNLYFTRPQGELAKRLVEIVGSPGKVFFSNSGAEANEALIKLARKYGNDEKRRSAAARFEIITFEQSFHGRTMAGISATGQEKVKVGFAPLLPGFRHLPFNDLAAVERGISEQTVAVLVEPIQGEGGINPTTPEFLTGLRRLCDERGLLLMFDEIQCGLGRTGNWCAWKTVAPEVVPDAVSWAKAIGGGFPLGASWFREKSFAREDGSEGMLCDVLQPGNHATTYGGTPLACSVSLAVLDTILSNGLVEKSASLGAFITSELAAIPGVSAVRGKGLLIGMELDARFESLKDGKRLPSQIVVNRLMENGLLTIPAGPRVIRLLPPLIVDKEQVQQALEIIQLTLRSLLSSIG
ncbi:MAG: aspartate aminotransferase family protein [Chthoniobacterales bacterium]